jgi:hypothetical protein
LEKTHQQLRFNKEQRKVVVSYAGVITLLVTAPEDMEVLRKNVQCYERATKALNVRK